MKKKIEEKKIDLDFREMDVTELTFPKATFDVVIDKGCLDSILCNENGFEIAEKMCKQVCKVLKQQGIFIVLTCGNPQNRIQIFDQWEYGWDIEHKVLKYSNQIDSLEQTASHTNHATNNDNNNNNNNNNHNNNKVAPQFHIYFMVKENEVITPESNSQQQNQPQPHDDKQKI